MYLASMSETGNIFYELENTKYGMYAKLAMLTLEFRCILLDIHISYLYFSIINSIVVTLLWSRVVNTLFAYIVWQKGYFQQKIQFLLTHKVNTENRYAPGFEV